MSKMSKMKKIYKLENLDCAVCAAKMAEAVKKIEGVENAEVSFFTQKMTVEADESLLPEIMKKAVKLCRRIEPDCKIIMN